MIQVEDLISFLFLINLCRGLKFEDRISFPFWFTFLLFLIRSDNPACIHSPFFYQLNYVCHWLNLHNNVLVTMKI